MTKALLMVHDKPHADLMNINIFRPVDEDSPQNGHHRLHLRFKELRNTVEVSAPWQEVGKTV
jgi:hypothetical protein